MTQFWIGSSVLEETESVGIERFFRYRASLGTTACMTNWSHSAPDQTAFQGSIMMNAEVSPACHSTRELLSICRICVIMSDMFDLPKIGIQGVIQVSTRTGSVYGFQFATVLLILGSISCKITFDQIASGI